MQNTQQSNILPINSSIINIIILHVYLVGCHKFVERELCLL